MAQEEAKVKVTYDDLKPFIVEVGKKIHHMLVEAQKKYGNRCNDKNRYEELYKRFGDPRKDPERFYDEYQWKWYYAICKGDDIKNPILEEGDNGYVLMHSDMVSCLRAAIRKGVKLL